VAGYEVESPLAAGLGAATSWYQGVQQKQDRDRKFAQDEEDRKLAASQSAAQASYWKATVDERGERDRLTAEGRDKDRVIAKQRADATTSQAKSAADRAKTAEKNVAFNHADRIAERLRKSADLRFHDAGTKMIAQSRINAMLQAVRQRIASGEVIAGDRLEAMMAAISERDLANIRTTDTSRANNVNTQGNTNARAQFGQDQQTARFNAGQQNQAQRQAVTDSVRAKKPIAPITPKLAAPGQLATPGSLTPKQQGYVHDAQEIMRTHPKIKLSQVQGNLFAKVKTGELTAADATAIANALAGGGGAGAQPPFPKAP